MVLLIDNYDSFSYNLYQLFGELTKEIRVVRNDQLSVEEIAALAPETIILSPGPGRPEAAGVCLEVVSRLKGQVKFLGVCLGHQVICQAYGGQIDYAEELMHGKQSRIKVVAADESQLFKNMSASLSVGRYHSLIAKENSLPGELKVTSRTANEEVMSVEDKENRVFGVQFHPESILTPLGKQMIQNFMEV
ncbi:anthranilate synthase component 2 [Lachnospiraceae bacterium PM6-15]|uniref:anthranilate synthase component II n=1 Tax=Ohessyouella blattaphilus TaxID=2949333 RepID=UPI003E18D950